jgi:hypothetical protein
MLEQICRVARSRHVPTQTLSEVTNDGSRVHVGLAQGFDRGRSTAFGKAFAPVIRHQWHVGVLRWARAELLIQKHLPGRARDQILASQDVRDLHGDVVAHDRQMVRECAISTPNHEITDAGLHVLANSRMNLVIEAVLARWHPNPNRSRSIWMSCSVRARSRITNLEPMRGARRVLNRLEDVFSAARTRVRLELRQHLFVCFGPFRLPVWSERATHIRSLIPIQAQPLEVKQDRFFRPNPNPCKINILDPQHELPVQRSNLQPSQQRRPSIAKVHLAGWTRREPASHRLLELDFHGSSFARTHLGCTAEIGRLSRGEPV